MKRNLFYFVCISLILMACNPRVLVKNAQTLSPRQEYEGFIIFEENDDFQIGNEKVIADISVGDAGFTMNCEYESVLELAKKQALALGANALKIEKHIQPGLTTCHQIKVKALILADIMPYEKQIIWHKNRKLRICDFKGSIENRPFEAATMSYFECLMKPNPVNGAITISLNTYFKCFESYFKVGEDSLFVLNHEQLHFDIAELYARKATKKIKEEITSIRELESKKPRITQIVEELWHEENLLNDLYDSEIYPDRSKQAAWTAKIQAELKELEAYQDKSILYETKISVLKKKK